MASCRSPTPIVTGASRDRGLRRWVLGSTPDRAIELARGADVLVIVYASEASVRGRAEDLLFPIHRHLSRLGSRDRPIGETGPATGESS